MKVLARNKLTDFMRKHASSRKALEAWFAEAERSDWQTPQDIKDRFSSADFLADNRVIFNIKGNHFRLVVKVRYQNGIVVVEWVGTHAEYSKKTF
ncbi:type II toxin-antitoxin system HigB family toxin [Marinobacter sp. W-8]|uniref:type II toxin-antitoxin system HigB family toxin n=1 Tax=Marinobacter sp. W-8 TaxID=3369658 RepID=UPI0037C645B2